MKLLDANCVKVADGVQLPTIGQGTITFSNAIPGAQYVLSVKYDSKSVLGSSFTGSAPPTVTYTFESSVNGVVVENSKTSIKMVPGCTVPPVVPPITVFGGAPIDVTAFEATASGIKVSLSPNPTPSDFRLVVSSASNETILVRVIDVNGQILKQLRATADQVLTFGSDLKQGMYMIEVLQGKKRRVVKGLKL